MLQPKRTKFRKQFKGRNRGVATRGNKVSFGEYGLKSAEHGRITSRQIEAARRAMSRHIKRGGKIRIHIFPPRLICLDIARLAASICLEVIRPCSADFNPYSPKLTLFPRVATPRLRPLNCLRNFVRFGCNILLSPISLKLYQQLLLQFAL